MPRQLLIILLAAGLAPAARAQVTADAPAGLPSAVVDLRTDAGVRLVGAAWEWRQVRIGAVPHRAPGPDLRPSGAPTTTMAIDLTGDALAESAGWEAVAPTALEVRRGTGRLSFVWYRTRLTVPAQFGAVPAAGMTLVLEIVVDDYAEVWVNGRQPLVLGQTGGPVARGFNAPNRVVLTRNARPGESFDVAVLGTNGPISAGPGNFIWVRSATLDVFTPAEAQVAHPVALRVEQRAPGLDAVLPADPKLEHLAGGFRFTEGPLWHPSGHLLFSDPNTNVIYRWTPDGEVSVFRTKSGYAGLDIGEYHQPGSNGLALDLEGRLTIDQHGERRVIRLEPTGAVTVLADRFEGKRLNSPNDLVYRTDGTLFFTDPAFGLPKGYDDPRKELPFSGVYALKDGRLVLLTRELKGPNGIAFSPDERFLYVGDWDDGHKVVMRYRVTDDLTLADATVFADLTREPGDDAIDGVKVDAQGNVYVSGPGGLWIFDASGRRLGLLVLPEHPHNMAWGDADGRTLYLAARSSIYRLRLNVAGAGRNWRFADGNPDASDPVLGRERRTTP